MSIEQLVLECRRASVVVFSIGLRRRLMRSAEAAILGQLKCIQGQEEPEEADIVMDEN